MKSNKVEGGRRFTFGCSSCIPTFSVITVVLNGERYIEKTIRSIISQNYTSFEYIVIDGGSTDSTLSIIRKYSNNIDYWISERDNGISDAFNIGYKLAHGKYINYQGDGDGFTSCDSLSIIASLIHGEMIIAGRINRTDASGEILFESPKLYSAYKAALLTRMPFPHQGLFLNRVYFDKYGLFDTSLRFSMDYELLLRSYSSPESVKTTDLVIANWRADGVGAGREHELFEEYKRIRIKWITLPKWLVAFISDLASLKFLLTEMLKSIYKDLSRKIYLPF